jgi:hypothetical protein
MFASAAADSGVVPTGIYRSLDIELRPTAKHTEITSKLCVNHNK